MTHRDWIAATVPLAVRTRHESLVESLVLVLRAAAGAHPELLAVARDLAADSPQMRRVLTNTGHR